MPPGVPKCARRWSLAIALTLYLLYLVLALGPEGNVGKGRYLMRRHQLALREEL